MLDRIEFVIEEAVVALKRNGMMTVAAISTAAIALLIFGGLGHAYLSLVSYLDSLQSEFELTISIKGDLPPSQLHKMAQELRSIPGVESVVLLPRDREWEKFIEKQNLKDLYAGQPNPFPDQFRVRLVRLEDAESVKKSLLEHPQTLKEHGVRDVARDREFAINLIKLVRLLGGLLTVLSFFAAGTLIYNTVRLTVLSRRNELRIMALVGASRGTIRWPFLLEGGIQGALGGLLAGLILWGISYYITAQSINWLGLGRQAESGIQLGSVILVLVAIGASLGILSAALSVRKFLRLGA
jgi:cell division transport system permease protein